MRKNEETINWELERLHVAEELFLDRMKRVTGDIRYVDLYTVREISCAAKSLSDEFIKVMRCVPEKK